MWFYSQVSWLWSPIVPVHHIPQCAYRNVIKFHAPSAQLPENRLFVWAPGLAAFLVVIISKARLSSGYRMLGDCYL